MWLEDRSAEPQLENDGVAERIKRAAGGSPLTADLRSRLELAFGADLTPVRLHRDTEADRLAEDVNATAFTTGNDIFFRSGAYDPSSEEGLRTLAHETAHTLQQSAGPVAGTWASCRN